MPQPLVSSAPETPEEKSAREAREEEEYRTRLRAAAAQSARHVAFVVGRGCVVDPQERDGRPFPVLLVEGSETGIDMLDTDRMVQTPDGPKPPRRPMVKRIGELLRLAKAAAASAK